MNPQEQEHTPSFELPVAPMERQTQPAPEQQAAAMNEQQSSIAVEQGAAPQQAPPQFAPQASAQGQPVPHAQMGQPAQPAPMAGMTPQIADDTDLIEKEWVMKAKEIVAQTAHDPHLQNREMNKFKADYLKKRYNKELKLSEDT